MLIENYEERIRHLCAKLASASEEEWFPLVLELKSAIREHLQSVRTLALQTLKNSEKAAKTRENAPPQKPAA